MVRMRFKKDSLIHIHASKTAQSQPPVLADDHHLSLKETETTEFCSEGCLNFCLFKKNVAQQSHRVILSVDFATATNVGFSSTLFRPRFLRHPGRMS